MILIFAKFRLILICPRTIDISSSFRHRECFTYFEMINRQIYVACMMRLKCSTDITRTIKHSHDAIHDLIKISRLAVRHPAWENCLHATNLPGIFRICYRSPTIDSFRRTSRLSCIVFVGAIGPATMLLRAQIFLDPRRCVTAGSTSSPRRLD